MNLKEKRQLLYKINLWIKENFKEKEFEEFTLLKIEDAKIWIGYISDKQKLWHDEKNMVGGIQDIINNYINAIKSTS